jgi:hypothetical protein
MSSEMPLPRNSLFGFIQSQAKHGTTSKMNDGFKVVMSKRQNRPLLVPVRTFGKSLNGDKPLNRFAILSQPKTKEPLKPTVVTVAPPRGVWVNSVPSKVTHAGEIINPFAKMSVEADVPAEYPDDDEEWEEFAQIEHEDMLMQDRKDTESVEFVEFVGDGWDA